MLSDKSKEFFKEISSLRSDRENMVFTVTDGEQTGEKAICADSQLVRIIGEDGFFSTHAKAVCSIKESGIHMIDGTRVYAETVGREKKLVICGGGHVSMPVITIGLMTGFNVTVLEDRPIFAANARNRGAEVICDSFENGLHTIKSDEDTYFVIVTRGHRWDQLCLRFIAEKPHAYVGLMGSRGRVAAVKENLRREGINEGFLGGLHAPIGLPIGGETPEEIAVSIMAEIIEVKNRKNRTLGYPKEILGKILGIHHTEAYEGKMVLSTIISRRGSAPRDIGTKMLILDDGTCIGTIGGGCMEAEVIMQARRMLSCSVPQTKVCKVDLTMEGAEDEGMVCGGTIEVLLEVL